MSGINYCESATPGNGDFDPAYREYEGAQAKIVVYCPRNGFKKSCENSLYLRIGSTTEFFARLSESSFADCLPRIVLADFSVRLLLDFLAVTLRSL